MSILKISALKIKGGRGLVGWCHWLLPPPSLIKGVWSLTLLICLMNDYVQGKHKYVKYLGNFPMLAPRNHSLSVLFMGIGKF